MGDVVPLFGASNGAAKNKKIKIHRGLRWPPIDDLLCNNQPKTGFHDRGGYEGRCDERDAQRKHYAPVLGALLVDRQLKI